jgi:predicted glycosyltransferase
MRYLFYMGHPAHFHLFKNTIPALAGLGHEVKVLIKKKDILESLLQNAGWNYHNINPEGRADNKFAIALKLLKRDIQFVAICRKFKPDLMIGTSAEISHAGKLLGIKSVVVNEDDAEIVPLFAKLAYPLATKILAPHCCSVGRWQNKKIGYKGYHELAYLHPDNFVPDKTKLVGIDTSRPFYILRFAKLTAHHDEGRKGINTEVAQKLIQKLEPHGNVYITSERELEPEFEKYRIQINPLHIHDALYYADMYIGDSQTMAAEAAVLGTPSIRFNDFVNQISYLNELEDEFGLTYGFRTSDSDKMYSKVYQLVNDADIKLNWKHKKEVMLSQCINLNKFMIDLFTDLGRIDNQ